MKSLGTVLIFILTCSLSIANDKDIDDKVAKAIDQQGPAPVIVPADGFVPTSTVALQVAEAILTPILKKEMKQQTPLRAHRKGDIWIIEGKERKTKCQDDDKNCYRLDLSPLYMEISAKDGRILKLYKYK